MKALTPTRRADLEHWKSLFLSGTLPPAPHRRLVEHFIRELPRDSSVLMAGCGVGQLVELMADKRPDLTWTLADYCQEAIERARIRLGSFCSAKIAAYLLADLDHQWPWPAKAFDCVVLCDVLEYVEAPAAVIGEARRVAGKLLAVTLQLEGDDPAASWTFDPIDPWRMLGGNMRVLHLTSQRRIACFSQMPASDL